MITTQAWVEWVIASYVAIYLGELKGNLDTMLRKVEWVLPST